MKYRTASHHTGSFLSEDRAPVDRFLRYAGAAGSLRVLRERSGPGRSAKHEDDTNRSSDRPLPGSLMQRFRDAIRARHYSRRTEQAYAQWIRRFIHHHGVRHPDEMGESEINAFLTYPIYESIIQKEVARAERRAGLVNRATCLTFRHLFTTQLLKAVYDIRMVQELLGYKVVKTTMIYMHVLNHDRKGVRSPLDEM